MPALKEVIFFSYNEKIRKGKFFKLVRIRFKKQAFEIENKMNEILILVKNGKIVFFNACLCNRTYFFLNTIKKCAKPKYLKYKKSEKLTNQFFKLLRSKINFSYLNTI